MTDLQEGGRHPVLDSKYMFVGLIACIGLISVQVDPTLAIRLAPTVSKISTCLGLVRTCLGLYVAVYEDGWLQTTVVREICKSSICFLLDLNQCVRMVTVCKTRTCVWDWRLWFMILFSVLNSR